MNKVDNVVDFKCIKVQSDVEWFMKTTLMPPGLTSGEISIRDIVKCLDTMTNKTKGGAFKLIDAFVEDNIDVRDVAISDYETLNADLQTKDRRFRFAQVLENYRTTINPLTAFYYECREMKRTWDASNAYHSWLLRTAQDDEFYSCIVKALNHDVDALSRYINRYYWLLIHMKRELPIEVYHSKQFMEDLTEYRDFFAELRAWSPS